MIRAQPTAWRNQWRLGGAFAYWRKPVHLGGTAVTLANTANSGPCTFPKTGEVPKTPPSGGGLPDPTQPWRPGVRWGAFPRGVAAAPRMRTLRPYVGFGLARIWGSDPAPDRQLILAPPQIDLTRQGPLG